MISVLDEERSRNAALRKEISRLTRALEMAEARDKARESIVQTLRLRAYTDRQTLDLLRQRLPAAVRKAQEEVHAETEVMSPTICPACLRDAAP